MTLQPGASRWLSRLTVSVLTVLVAVGLGVSGDMSAFGQTNDQSARGAGPGKFSLHLDLGTLASQPPASQAGPDQSEIVLSEYFEGPWPAGSWRAYDQDGASNGEYFWANRCTGHNSARSAWAVGGGADGSRLSCGDFYPHNTKSVALYGPLDFSDVLSAEMSYDAWIETECVGTDCVDKRDELRLLWFHDPEDIDGYWWAGSWTDDPSADPQGWVSATHDLTSVVGYSQVWVGMQFVSDASTHKQGGAYVDNLVVRVERCQETAFVRQLTTDRSCYTPGSQIGVLVDVGTSLSSQAVKVEAQLAQLDVIWASAEKNITAPDRTVLQLQVPPTLQADDYTMRAMIIDVATGCFQDMEEVTVRVDPVCGTVTPPVPSATPPTATPTPTPTATPTECPPTRPAVPLSCTDTNYLRNPRFEKYNRSWGEYSAQGRELITSQAVEGFFSAQFDSPAAFPANEWLYQFIDIPPDVTAASFSVSDFQRTNSAVNPPPFAGDDHFHASLYDVGLGQELVRLWEFDPLSPTECPVDPPNYNLTAAELDAIRGRTVVLAFHLQKETVGWQVSVLIDRLQFLVCSAGPPCRVERDKRAHPTVVEPGGETTVMLQLTGLDGACLPHRTSADVMLVIDRSGSMGEQGGKPIADAKAAAIGFVNRMDMATDQVGLVSFADTALRNKELMNRAGEVKTAIGRLVASGNTNIKDAIRLAQEELASPRHKPGNAPVMILLSDGLPNRPSADPDPRPEAAAARAAGTRIFTIGLGDQVDPNLMRELASSPADYFAAPDSSQLDAIYQQIAGAISGAPATSITIIDRLSRYVTLVPNSFTGSPLPDVSPDRRTLTWRIPRLGLETRRWSYRVRMTDSTGTWPTNDSASATYTDSNGNPASLTFPVPEVTVVGPGHRPEVMCRDHPADDGSVPSNPNGEAWWNSPDIWVRTDRDGIPSHQNPLLGQTNYLYVRVRNIGDDTVNDITVYAYDALGALNLRWPDDWVPQIGTATIDSLSPGGVAVVSIPWTPVMSGHTCFLVRIEASDDQIQFDGWVPFENNICQRNVQIIEGSNPTTTVSGGNRERGSGYGKFSLSSRNFPRQGLGKLKFKDPKLYQRWRLAGGSVSGGRVNDQDNSIEFGGGGAISVNDGDAVNEVGEVGEVDLIIEDIPFEGEEIGAFTIEITAPAEAKPPTLELVEWMEGQPVGGSIIRPPVLRPYVLHLPSLAANYDYAQQMAVHRPPPWRPRAR